MLDWKPSPCLLTSFLHNYNIPTIGVPIDSFFVEQFWLNLPEIYLLALKSDRLNLQKERTCGDRLFVPVLQTQFPSKNTPWIAYIKKSVSKQTSTFFSRLLFYNFADLVLCTVNMKGRKCQNVRSLMFLLKIQTHIFWNCQYIFLKSPSRVLKLDESRWSKYFEFIPSNGKQKGLIFLKSVICFDFSQLSNSFSSRATAWILTL